MLFNLLSPYLSLTFLHKRIQYVLAFFFNITNLTKLSPTIIFLSILIFFFQKAILSFSLWSRPKTNCAQNGAAVVCKVIEKDIVKALMVYGRLVN